MSIYDPQIDEKKRKEEEEEEKLDSLRKWRESQGNTYGDNASVPESTASPAQVQTAISNMGRPAAERETFSIAEQRGYNPRFDDPDYGESDDDDDKDRSHPSLVRDSSPSSVSPRPSSSDPYAATAAPQPASSSLYDPGGSRDDDDDDDKERSWLNPRRWVDEARSAIATDRQEAADYYADPTQAPPQSQALNNIMDDRPNNRADDLWMARHRERRDTDWDGPSESPMDAYQNAPSYSELLTGEDDDSFLSKSVLAPYEALPKLAAAGGNLLEQARAPLQGDVFEAVSDYTASAFDAFAVPADAAEMETAGTRYSFGERVSAAGETALGMDRGIWTMDQDEFTEAWNTKYLQELSERESARGGSFSDLTPEEMESASWALAAGYSGKQAQANVFDGVLNKEQTVARLEEEAKQLYAEGEVEEAAAKGAEAAKLSAMTPKDFVDENFKIGPELVASMLFDPLNFVDAIAGVAKIGPVARRAGKATEAVLGNDAADVLKAMDGVSEAIQAGHQPGAGKRAPYNVTGAFFGLTDESQSQQAANNAWKVVTSLFGNVEDKSEARALMNAALENPQSFPEALAEAGKGSKALADPKSLESLEIILPGLKDEIAKVTALDGAGTFDPRQFASELHTVMGDVADDYYKVNRDALWKKPSNFLRTLMSEQFLNNSPRHLMNNALSAYGHLMTDGQLSMRPMKNITADLTAKFGEGMGTARVSEAYGALSDAGKATTGAGGYYGQSSPLRKVTKYASAGILTDASDTPRWAGSGAGGEQNLYTRGLHSRFRNELSSQWERYVNATLPGQLVEAGVDPGMANKLAQRVVEDGVEGNSSAIMEGVSKYANGNGSLFSLADTGAVDGMFTNPENYADLRKTFDSYATGSMDGETASKAIQDAFAAEKAAMADIYGQAGGAAPTRHYFSGTDDASDVAETARSFEHAGRGQGGTQAARGFTSAAQKNLDEFYNSFVSTLKTAGEITPEARGAFTDAWRDVNDLKFRARVQQGKAYTAWTESARGGADWKKYEETVRNTYNNMFAAQRNIVQELGLNIDSAKAGTYTKKYDDALDLMDRVTNVSPGELEDAMKTGSTSEAIQAQRQYVDYYAAETYATAQRYGNDIGSVDTLMSAETDVERAAMAATAEVRQLRAEARSGDMTWDAFDIESAKVWENWAAGTKNRYRAAQDDITRTATGAVRSAEEAPVVPPPTIENIREAASRSGVGTITEDGAPYDEHILRAINKDLGTDYRAMADIPEDDLRRASDAMDARAGGAPSDAKEANGISYTLDGDGNVERIYDSNAKQRAASGNAQGPTIPDAAAHQYEQLELAEKKVLDSLRQTAVQQGAIGRDMAVNITGAVRNMLPEYDNILNASLNAAEKGADFSMLDYSARRGFDTVLATVVPYHYWMTRSTKNWLERIAAKPGMTSAYLDTHRASEQYREQEEIPQRYEGMVPVPGMENTLFAKNPLDYFIPVRELYETNGFADPENASSSVGKALESASVFGLGTFPVLDAGVKIAEGRGDEIDWGNMVYPYPVVRDIYKAFTGDEIQALKGPWTPYTEARAGGELAVAGDFSPEAVQYGQQIIANEENGADPYLNIPEHMREEAAAANQAMRERQGMQSGVRTVSSFLGPKVASYAPEEAAARAAGSQYGEAGYSYENQAGSQAAKDSIMEKYPWMGAWWSKNNLIPGNIEDADSGVSAQTAQYWDEYTTIAEAETAAVATFITEQMATGYAPTTSEVYDIRQPFRDQKEELKGKYPETKEYQQRRDRTTNAMNPIESATQIVEDVLRYNPPGKPEYPGEDASDAEKQKYYAAKEAWEAKVLDHKERVFEQLAESRDLDDQYVYQTVTGRFADDLRRGFELRFASATEVGWSEQTALQEEVTGQFWDNYHAQKGAEKAAQNNRVTEAFGSDVAGLVQQYLDYPKGSEERTQFGRDNEIVYEAMDEMFSPGRREDAKSQFGENIYEQSRAYPGKYADDPEAWKAWKESVGGDDGVDNVFAFFDWGKAQREADKANNPGKPVPPMAPKWYEYDGPRPYGSDRGPVNLNRPGEGYQGPGASPTSREEYVNGGGMMFNPFMGYDDRLPPNGLNRDASPSEIDAGDTMQNMDGNPFIPPNYKSVPGYNALPPGSPKELAVIQEAIANGTLTPEIMAAVQEAVYATSLGGDGGAGGPGTTGEDQAAGSSGGYSGYSGRSYGGSYGGYGGGGGYAPQRYPPRVDPYMQRLLQWRGTRWNPGYDEAQARRNIAKVGPRG